MATYKPLFMYVSPASVPQIVAHIQKYLADNPIVSDPEAIAEVIQQYIEDHPEIIAVASVNGKTGNVVLTGSDININASTAVTVETQLLNLASMIASAGSNISQIQAQLETIYTNISTLDGKVTANETAIDNLETSVSGQGTRLAAAENDIDSLEAAQAAQNTRLNAAEGDITSLKTRMTQAETDIDSNESSIATLNTTITNMQNENVIKSGDVFNVTDRYILNGFVTAGTQSIWCTIPLGKKISASSVTITKLSGILRGISGYLDSSTDKVNFISGNFSSTASIINADCGILNLYIHKNTAFANTSNNTPVSIDITAGDIVLTFN